MKRAALLSILSLGALSPQGKDKVPADGIFWSGSWDEALKEAQERNIPIHFTVHKDG